VRNCFSEAPLCGDCGLLFLGHNRTEDGKVSVAVRPPLITSEALRPGRRPGSRISPVRDSAARKTNVLRRRVVGPAEPYDLQPNLSPAQRHVLDGLRAHGIAVTTFDDLVGDGALWLELEAEMRSWVARAEKLAPKLAKPKHKSDYLIRRWTPDSDGGVVDDPRIPSDSPWVRLAASDALLDVVNSYRGVYTKLVGLDNWYTVPFPESEERVASQLWHRDPEDVHVVKCFLYFSDVDEDAGPFEYVPGSANGGRYGELWQWGTEKRWYPPPEEFEARIPMSDRVRLTGPKGTLILCDTAGFHRGGYARAKPRVLESHTYISPDAKHDKLYHEIVWRNVDGLSWQSRYALAC